MGGAEHQRQAFAAVVVEWCLVGLRLQAETQLARRLGGTGGNFQVLAADQGVEVGGACQAQLGFDQPEATALAGNALAGLQDAQLDAHGLQVILQLQAFHLAHLQSLVAQQGAYLEAFGAVAEQLHEQPLVECLFLVVEQIQALALAQCGGLGFWGMQGNTAADQALQ